ncbi:hypothetical protein CXF79_11215 [Colwellia sp. Bg11-28]|nr:hypothetical protein CXF79_11215 [Colwellia sp. Bg11-28]
MIMKKHFDLLNGNRMVIYVLSLIGFFYDVNIAYIMALTLWLWLPQCLQLELLLLKAIKH